jgi:hypothetical protein
LRETIICFHRKGAERAKKNYVELKKQFDLQYDQGKSFGLVIINDIIVEIFLFAVLSTAKRKNISL